MGLKLRWYWLRKLLKQALTSYIYVSKTQRGRKREISNGNGEELMIWRRSAMMLFGIGVPSTRWKIIFNQQYIKLLLLLLVQSSHYGSVSLPSISASDKVLQLLDDYYYCLHQKQDRAVSDPAIRSRIPNSEQEEQFKAGSSTAF